MEELRQGRHIEQIRVRAVREAEKLPYQGLPEANLISQALYKVLGYLRANHAPV